MSDQGWIKPHWEIACPRCNAPVGQSCRTLKTRRVTDTHLDRINAPRRTA